MASGFAAAGGTVLAKVGFDATGKTFLDLYHESFSTELAGAFAGNPEALYLPVLNEILPIANNSVHQGYFSRYRERPPVYFSGDGGLTDDLLTNGLPEVLDNISGAAPSPNLASPDIARLAAAMEAAGLGSPRNYDAFRYDAVYVMAYAIQKAGTLDPEVVKTQIPAVTRSTPGAARIKVADWASAKAALLGGSDIDYDGASGPIELQANGDPGVTSRTYVIWRPKSDATGNYGFVYSPVASPALQE